MASFTTCTKLGMRSWRRLSWTSIWLHAVWAWVRPPTSPLYVATTHSAITATMPRTIQKVMPAPPCRGSQFSLDWMRRGERTMDASAFLKEFTTAVERRDGKVFARLFTEDGVYHDVFYGAFKGREKIAEMIDDWFHRTARDFRWEMFRPVSDGT